MRVILISPAVAIAGLAVPGQAMAHAESALAGSPLAALALLVTGVIYLAGFTTMNLRRWWRCGMLFIAGWLVLGGALVGPLETAAHDSLAAHMTQHMLLIAVAPPLLLLSKPLPVMLAGLPRAIRRGLAKPVTRCYRKAAATGVAAFLVHAAAIWIWHMPAAYEAALRHPLLHDLEHASFLLTALWFWWVLIAPIRTGRGAFGPALLMAVMTMAHTGLLGALLTFAPQSPYPSHGGGFTGLSELEDQQLAGLIMWVPGGMIYTATAAALAVVWLNDLSRRALRDGSQPVVSR